jgi:hypothetical protein
MKKIAVPLFLIVFSIVLLLAIPFCGTQASFRDISKSRISIKAATLNLVIGDNWSRLSKPQLDLGEIKPGESGIAEIPVSNAGSIPGKMCITVLKVAPEYLQVKSNDLCDLIIGPTESAFIVINWSLPAELHDTGLDGTEFDFSYSVFFENGYKITQKVVLKGKIIDPADTPTPTITEKPAEIIVEPTEIPVETPTPVEITTEVPTEVLTEVITEVPTEVPSAAPTDIQVEPTVEIPTDMPAPTEKPVEVLDETPVS